MFIYVYYHRCSFTTVCLDIRMGHSQIWEAQYLMLKGCAVYCFISRNNGQVAGEDDLTRPRAVISPFVSKDIPLSRLCVTDTFLSFHVCRSVHVCMGGKVHMHMCRVQRIILNIFLSGSFHLVSTLPAINLYVYSTVPGILVLVLGIEL